jgi:ATP-dependent DNA helicase RecG
VEERPRIEGNLAEVWQEALTVVGSLMRQPSRLVGNRFRPVSEYPRFSWQEALLNAIAHRDYSVQGSCTEVWLFDDRMEVNSPGGLLPELSLVELLSLQRVHCSRNPRLMRALVDLGLARDQGEGIPRMFAEMADAFLPSPQIEPTPHNMRVILHNTTTLNDDDRAFVARLGGEELSDEDFRALLHSHRSGQVDNASLRSLIGLDTLGASQVLRRLRDRGLLELHPAGSHSFYTLTPRLRQEGIEASDRGEQPADWGEQPADWGEQNEPALQAAITALGERPRKQRLRSVLQQLCMGEWRTPAWLALQLNMDARKLSERHLSPMVASGELQRRFPETPTHAEQAYRTTVCQSSFRLKP